MIRTVMIYMIVQLMQNPLMIGYIIFEQMLPMAVFGVFSGSLPDRFSKRWLLVASNGLQLLVVIGMWFVRDHAWLLIGMMVIYANQGLRASVRR